MYGYCFQEQRYMPYRSRNDGGNGVGPGSGSAGSASHQSTLCPSQQQQQHQQQQQQQIQVTSVNASSYCQLATNRSLNSSLNGSSYSDSGRNSTLCSSNTHNSGCTSPHYSNYSTDRVGGAGNRSGTAGLSASVSPMPTPSIQPPQGPGTGASQGQHTVIIGNFDKSMDRHSIHQFLLCQLEEIAPYISLTVQYPWLAQVKVSSEQCATQVLVKLHQKQIGQQRLKVSYVKASSTLRSQVAGVLKDVPYYSLSTKRFRQLFQTRFNFSPSWADLHGIQDVCTITYGENNVMYIALQPDLIGKLNNSKLVGTFQHSLPYCMFHFPQEKEIEPLPSVSMSIVDLQSHVHMLLKSHESDIPVASVLSCFEHVLRMKIRPDKNGVPLEHLLCCVQGVHITNNRFGIKVLSRIEHDPSSTQDSDDTWAVNLPYLLQRISLEVVEVITVSPKCTIQFTRFMSTYSAHFDRQIRLVDYGCTRLIDLFEELGSVVQVMGDGENRTITLTHRVQMQRFTNELLTILRSRTEQSIRLSQLPMVFPSAHRRRFNVTDYGVCDIVDIVNGLANSNSITAKVCNGNDVLFSIRKQTANELERICSFAADAVHLFRASPQFSIRFTKFAQSYHRRYGYQCHPGDYGFLNLVDLLGAISGIVEMERSNAEDCEIYLNHQVARRIFAEQVQASIKYYTGQPEYAVGLNKILSIHQSKCGYLMQPSCLGCSNMYDAVNALPYTEVLESGGGGGGYMLRSHLEDPVFRARTYRACAILIESETDRLSVAELSRGYGIRFGTVLTEKDVFDMKHALLMEMDMRVQTVTLTPLMKFVVRIAQVVKHRGPLKVHDLSVSAGTCFQLGFPSVSSVLNYFADVFAESNSARIRNRSVITLNRGCILSQVRFPGEDRSSLGGTSLGTSDLAPIAEQHPPVDTRYRPPTDTTSTVLGPPSANPCFAQPQQQQQQHPVQLQRPKNSSFLPLQPLQPSRLLNQQHELSPMNPYCASNINRNPYASVPYGFGGGGRDVSSTSSGAFTSLPGSMGQYAPIRMYERKQGKENNFYSWMETAPVEQLGNAFRTQCSLRASGSVEAPTMQPHSQGQGADGGALAQTCSPLLQSWKRSTAADQSAPLNLGISELIRNLKLQYNEPPKPDTAPGLNVPYWSDPIWNDTDSFTGP